MWWAVSRIESRISAEGCTITAFKAVSKRVLPLTPPRRLKRLPELPERAAFGRLSSKKNKLPNLRHHGLVWLRRQPACGNIYYISSILNSCNIWERNLWHMFRRYARFAKYLQMIGPVFRLLRKEFHRLSAGKRYWTSGLSQKGRY